MTAKKKREDDRVATISDWVSIVASVTLGHFPVKARGSLRPAFTDGGLTISVTFDTPDFFTGDMTTLNSQTHVGADKVGKMTVREARAFVRHAVIDGLRHEIDEHLSVDKMRWDPHRGDGPHPYTPPDPELRRKLDVRFDPASSFLGIDRGYATPMMDEMIAFGPTQVRELEMVFEDMKRKRKDPP